MTHTIKGIITVYNNVERFFLLGKWEMGAAQTMKQMEMHNTRQKLSLYNLMGLKNQHLV